LTSGATAAGGAAGGTLDRTLVVGFAVTGRAMARALRESGRDIVFSLSNTAPFEHAPVWQDNANCWRTTGDIRDAWSRADLPANEQWSLGLMDIAEEIDTAPFRERYGPNSVQVRAAAE